MPEQDTKTGRKTIILEVPAYMTLEIIGSLASHRTGLPVNEDDYLDLIKQIKAQLREDEAQEAFEYTRKIFGL